MMTTRWGNLCNIWSADCLTLKLKLQLYKSVCCYILTYDSEAWVLNKHTYKLINGVNDDRMLTHITITGLSQHAEATSTTTTFNLVKWIRAQRFKWVGHILHMDDELPIRQTLHYIFHHPQTGDILMDVHTND